MANPWVTTLGTIEDDEGGGISVMVDYDRVRILGHACFNQEQAEGFAQLFTAACWATARQASAAQAAMTA